MKKLLNFAMLMLISFSMASYAYEAEEEVNAVDSVYSVPRQMGALDSVIYHYPLYEYILLKGTETNVDVYVRKGEKLDPKGIVAYGNTFVINFIDENNYPFAKKRCCVVILKDDEMVDHVGRQGIMIRTWDRAIRVRYHYEK